MEVVVVVVVVSVGIDGSGVRDAVSVLTGRLMMTSGAPNDAINSAAATSTPTTVVTITARRDMTTP